jgi:hypothetical protein
MKADLPYFLNFPKGFCSEAKVAVEMAMKKGINLQLVGLPGSGKTLFFRSLAVDSDVFYHIDGNLLTEKGWGDLLDRLEKVKGDGNKMVVLVDSFEEIAEKILSAYDQYRDYVTFVFSVEKEVQTGSSCDVFYMKPFSEAETGWFAGGFGGKGSVGKEILNMAGGYPAIIKRLSALVEGGKNLEEVVDKPWEYADLSYQLEEIFRSVGSQEAMKKYGLVDSDGNFVSKVLGNFVKHKGGKGDEELTALESKVFKSLSGRKGEVVERDELIGRVWGNDADSDISDHALDQLIHRLREKLKKDGLEIKTIKGRGYILN